MGCGTGSTLSNNQGRIQNGTRQYQHIRLNPVIHRVLYAETKHLPQPSRFLLGKTDRRGDIGGILEAVIRN